MSKRIYVVEVRADAGDVIPTKSYLVRASQRGPAMRYVAEKHMKVEVASTDDAVKLTGMGVKVEEVG